MLRARVGARERAGTDASEASAAVLERQLATQEPLGADERRDPSSSAPTAARRRSRSALPKLP
jgi:predicted kinase